MAVRFFEAVTSQNQWHAWPVDSSQTTSQTLLDPHSWPNPSSNFTDRWREVRRISKVWSTPISLSSMEISLLVHRAHRAFQGVPPAHGPIHSMPYYADMLPVTMSKICLDHEGEESCSLQQQVFFSFSEVGSVTRHMFLPCDRALVTLVTSGWTSTRKSSVAAKDQDKDKSLSICLLNLLQKVRNVCWYVTVRHHTDSAVGTLTVRMAWTARVQSTHTRFPAIRRNFTRIQNACRSRRISMCSRTKIRALTYKRQ